ncbi:hypothetical protein ACIBF5_21525 [Micromonospora sp. NPDC050417]|uniref:hypothetical protein n=1 Tax=Micromonospora sp. NPDC050417 TaxID=3364280 RepID=UPI0037B3A66C
MTMRRGALPQRAAQAAVAGVVVLLGALGPVVLPPTAVADAPGPTVGALPDRIDTPVIGTLHATDRPRLGPAALLFSGQADGLTGGDEDGVVGIVGADSDRYRTFEVGFEAPVGEQVVLSPDGRVIAYPFSSGERNCVQLVDLGDGERECLDSPHRWSALTVPLGWSTDGSRLVVREMVPVDPQRSAYETVLSIVEVGTRRTWRLASGTGVDGPLSHDGFTVAFAPDQRRVAYQMAGAVTVADLDGQVLSSFAVAAGTTLAGKGAWTPDGSALAVVEGVDGARMLRYLDPATGAPATGPVLPAVPGVTTIRLLGWRPSGGAMVVAYHPEPAMAASVDDATAYDNVRTVRVLALDPAATAPVTLLTAPDQVLAIDVADDVVHGGRVRSADPPSGVGPWFWFWAGSAGVALLVLILVRVRPQPAHWSERRASRRAGTTPAPNPAG